MKINVKTIPNAKKNELQKSENGYRARIQCPPADGKANAALTELLAKEFGVPKSKIEIVSGKTRRNKIVQITE